jgi:hypothetical protein
MSRYRTFVAKRSGPERPGEFAWVVDTSNDDIACVVLSAAFDESPPGTVISSEYTFRELKNKHDFKELHP